MSNEINFNFPDTAMEKKVFLDWFKKYLFTKFNNLTEIANHYGVSAQFISMILKGKRPVPDNILATIGFEKIAVRSYIYSPIEIQDLTPIQKTKKRIIGLLSTKKMVTMEHIETNMEDSDLELIIESLSELREEDIVEIDTVKKRIWLKKPMETPEEDMV